MVMAVGALVGGCKSSSPLDQRTTPYRATYGNEKIDLRTLPPGPDTAAAGGATTATAPAELGNWTYTTPTSVTRDEHKNGTIDEVSFFVGRPGADDLPFLVISTTRDHATRAEHDPAFKIQQQREYSMNGNVVHEWTGLTATGSGFSELLVRRPGDTAGQEQVCHAIALARTEEEQKLALAILSSITWTPAQ
jgi:hypothetical protein